MGIRKYSHIDEAGNRGWFLSPPLEVSEMIGDVNLDFAKDCTIFSSSM